MICWKMPRITNESKLSDLLIETRSFFEKEDREFNLPRNSLAVLIRKIMEFYPSYIPRSAKLDVCKRGKRNMNL
jgi:hypothetical protein